MHFDFSNMQYKFDPNVLKKQLEEIFRTMNLTYKEENYKEEKDIPVHFLFVTETTTFPLNIYLSKAEEFRLNIVAPIRFSPEHIQALRKLRNYELTNFLTELKMWVLPREVMFYLELDEENNFNNARYGINCPLYTDDFSIGAMERQITKASKMVDLINLIIQKHLNKLIADG